MTLLENIRRTAEKVTGRRRPAANKLRSLVRKPTAKLFSFEDDGFVPNHPRWPLIVLRHAVRLPRALDPAAVIEDLFESNGWGESWRGGVYDYLHYHSRIHEVMGVARGHAKIRFGGEHGRTLQLKAGDVAILPAGTGHQCLGASKGFLVVGAYPRAGTYDECKPIKKDHARNRKRVRKTKRPRRDPVSGRNGPLLRYWK